MYLEYGETTMVDILRNFTAISDKPGKVLSTAEKHLPKMLAILMLIYVFVSIEHSLYINDYHLGGLLGESGKVPIRLIADLIMFVSAIIILYQKEISNSRAISIYLLTLSVTRIITYFPYLFDTNSLSFAFGILICTISVNMFVTGAFFFRGISRNRDSVMMSSLLMTLIYTLILSFYLHYSIDVWETLRLNLALLLQLILYLILFITLDTYDVHINTDVGRVDATVRSLRARTGAGDKTVISLQEMNTIANGFGDMEGWTKVEDGGPAEYEYRVTISMRDSNSEMLLQKWKGSDKIHFTIADTLQGSLIYAKRFSANRFVYDSDDDSVIAVRFIDDDGNLLRFHVVHTDEAERLHEEAQDEA